MANPAAVDWAAVDERLPTRQEPANRQRRKMLFKEMDPSGNGTLTKSELQVGIPKLLQAGENRKNALGGSDAKPLVPLGDLKPAVNCAFQCAKSLAPAPKVTKAKSKAKAKKKAVPDTDVDIKEFHAFLVAFRQYIELAVLFQTLDKSKDLLLSYKECEGAMPLLQKWGIERPRLRAKFPDDFTGTMQFSDFANWCISSGLGSLDLKLDDSDNEEVVDRKGAALLMDAAGSQTATRKVDEELVHAQNHRRIIELFQRLDVDNSGTISEEELAHIFVEMNKQHKQGLSAEQVRSLLAAADSNKDGVLDVDEFMKWMFK